MQIIYTSGNYKRTIVKSIVAIVLGLVLVLWPTEVLNYTVKIIGAVFCVTGIISFLVSMRDQDERSARGLTSFNGIGSIILGILLWSMADFFTNMLMYLLGFILIVAGIGQLVMLTSASSSALLKLSPVAVTTFCCSLPFPASVAVAEKVMVAVEFAGK